ncbi:hypothetical protein YPF_4555 [Yersinia pestis biovar Orientalis str. India 195]|nr:hypothetical protein YPF_4555 [Yersinia pestis biovar Orientalis str. India 195]EEO85890.1 hypothetical protein YPH_1777 [Yersinia pestis biovar Orientalis str. PEXU2]
MQMLDSHISWHITLYAHPNNGQNQWRGDGGQYR